MTDGDRRKPIYNAVCFTPAELAHLLALVKGGGFTGVGVLALKAKLTGMVDGPQ